jgi:hypothetical protein
MPASGANFVMLLKRRNLRAAAGSPTMGTPEMRRSESTIEDGCHASTLAACLTVLVSSSAGVPQAAPSGCSTNFENADATFAQGLLWTEAMMAAKRPLSKAWKRTSRVRVRSASTSSRKAPLAFEASLLPPSGCSTDFETAGATSASDLLLWTEAMMAAKRPSAAASDRAPNIFSRSLRPAAVAPQTQ